MPENTFMLAGIFAVIVGYLLYYSLFSNWDDIFYFEKGDEK